MLQFLKVTQACARPGTQGEALRCGLPLSPECASRTSSMYTLNNTRYDTSRLLLKLSAFPLRLLQSRATRGPRLCHSYI
jgi:hypothetical protein